MLHGGKVFSRGWKMGAVSAAGAQAHCRGRRGSAAKRMGRGPFAALNHQINAAWGLGKVWLVRWGLV